MDAVRVNFSHASHREAGHILTMARDAARDCERPLAVIADLQGPKIRVGDLPVPIEIAEGERYMFVPEERASGMSRQDGPPAIPSTYDALADDLSAGDTILLDDGRLEFRVEAVEEHRVTATALNAGSLASQKGMNLPGVAVKAPSLSEKDVADARFACAQHVDYLALSFVRRPEDIAALRKVATPGILLIAKIEKDQAVRHLAEIMQRADGVMVARGDLGVELPYEEVPMVQKRILRLGQELARLSITATQMLESMTRAPRPTRAEVSDVANALLDGTDAVMLSAETATGGYPAEAVEAMDRIIRRTERDTCDRRQASVVGARRHRTPVQETRSAAIAAAALEAIQRLGCRFMVTFTRSGFTARVVSAHRPAVPILAVTDQWRTYNQLALAWGVVPLLFRGEVTYGNMLELAVRRALDADLGRPGDSFVVTAGVPFHVAGTTNMIRVEEL